MNKDSRIYAAHAFNADLGNEAIDGRITFTQFLFRFESEAGEVVIPLDELDLEPGEDGDERMFFSHEKHPDWSIYTPDQAILDDPVFTTNNHLRAAVPAAFEKSVWRKAVLTTVIFCGSIMLVCLIVSWSISRLVQAAVNSIPPDAAQELGDKICAQIKTEVDVTQDPRLIAELKTIFAQIRPGLADTNMQIQFHIIESDVPNAGSIPGHIFVTRGLFGVLITRDEMAGVLSHEIGHITKKHVFRLIIVNEGPAYILKRAFRNSRGTLSAIARGSQFVLGRSFSRELECEADDEGWRSLVAANVDPRGMIDALQKLKDYETRHIHLQSEMLSTHPATDWRIDRLESHWRKLNQQSGFNSLTDRLP